MEMPEGSSSECCYRKCQLQMKAYAKVDAKPPERHHGCIPVMVSIMALSGTEEQHVPLDLVVVLHIRTDRNVPKNWWKLLKKTMDVIVEKLDVKDRLAVIPVQSTLVTKLNVSSAKVLGDPRKITTETPLVADLESAESILHARESKDKERRAGHIIVISNSKDDTGSLLAWRFRSVHAFGFRDSDNARTMHSISSSSGSTYGILDDEQGEITKAFLACINRIISTIAVMPIEMTLKCDQGMVLSSIDTPGTRYIIRSNDNKVGIVWPRVHLAGVPTKFIIYLDQLHHGDLTKLFTVHVKYGHVSDKLNVQIVNEGMDESKVVAEEIVRIKAVKIVTDTIHKVTNDWEQLHAAENDLREQWKTIVENSDYGKEAAKHGQIPRLCADMREMGIRMYNNYYWLEYLLTWMSHQRSQLPLPQQFMYNQFMNDRLMPLRIFAKVNDILTTTTGHQKHLPVLVQVMAPEAWLAEVKRASIDLITVLDISSGAKEMEQISQKRLKLLVEAKEKKKEHNKANKMLKSPIDECNKAQKMLNKAEKPLEEAEKMLQKETMTTMQKLLYRAEEVEKQLLLLKTKEDMQERQALLDEAEEDKQKIQKLLKKANDDKEKMWKLLNKAEEDLKKRQELHDKSMGAKIKMQKLHEAREGKKKIQKLLEKGKEDMNKMQKLLDEAEEDMKERQKLLDMVDNVKVDIEKLQKLLKKVMEDMKIRRERLGNKDMDKAWTLLDKAMENMKKRLDRLGNMDKEKIQKQHDKAKKDTQERQNPLYKPKRVEVPKEVMKAEEEKKKLQKLLDEVKEDRRKMDNMEKQITQKTLEMNIMAITIKALCIKAKKTEEDLKKVMEKEVETDKQMNALHKDLKEVMAEEQEMEKQITQKIVELKIMDEQITPKRLEVKRMEEQITHKRSDMNRIANEMKELHIQAEEMKQNVKRVVDNTRRRLELLIKAMDLVIKKLSGKDRLSIIPVQFPVTEHTTNLLKLAQQGRSVASNKVKSLVDLHIRKLTMASVNNEVAKTSQGEEQLNKVMKLVRNCFPVATSSDIPSWTASMSADSANVGVSTNLGRALLDARKILDDRQAKEMDRMGVIIVISDSDDDSISLQTLNPNYITHVFGFRTTHNTRALHHKARSSNGVYGILNDERDQITEDFMDCTKNITSIIAVDSKIDFVCSHSSSALLSTIESGHFRHFIDNDRKSCSILMDSLYAGAEMDFMVYLDNIREQDFDNLAKLLTVRVKWLHALSRVEETLEGEVVFVRNSADIDRYKQVAKDSAHAEAVKIAPEITAPTYN